MTAVLMTLPVIKFTDSTGAPLAGGKVYFFTAGTSTPKDTFTTAAGNVANTNPVILDSQGAAVIFLSGSYKVNVTDSTGTQQSNWPVDNITSFSTGSSGGTFSDASFTVQNAADPTKQIQLDVSAVSTGTTSKISVPAGNFTIAKASDVAATSYRGAVAYNSAPQAIPNNTNTNLTFDSETIDTDGIHSTSANTSRMTIPAGVTKIRLLGCLSMLDTGSGTVRQISFLKNGSTYPTPSTRSFITWPNADGNTVGLQSISPATTCIAGDYFEMQILQQSGGSLSTAETQTWFELQILA